MKARYDAHTQPRSFTANDAVYTRLAHEKDWRPAVVRSHDGQIVELSLEDGRSIRRHLDHVRSRMMATQETLTSDQAEAKREPVSDFVAMASNDLSPASSKTPLTDASVEQPTATPDSHIDPFSSSGMDTGVTQQTGANTENAEIRRSTRIRRPVERFQAGVD